MVWAAMLALSAARAGADPLGQIDANYEPHDDLVLVSGQLTGFAEACGFGRKPDRDEMMRWYQRHQLARSMARIQTLYDLGIDLGREVPCTAEENVRLTRRWEELMLRTETFVRTYRTGPQAAGRDGTPPQSGSTGPAGR
jgi:hypothetical protein